MASAAVLRKTLNYSCALRTLSSNNRQLSGVATAGKPQSEHDYDALSSSSSSSFTFSSDENASQTRNINEEDPVYMKGLKTASSSSVCMPMSFMTGSIVGKRFYQKVTTRKADDGNGWTVMLDYRTLKTPSKRPLRCPTPALAMAIAAEWDYQQIDGIRPFTLPLMKLACTALERVPLTRPKVIGNLMKKFHQDLVFCRAPRGNDYSSMCSSASQRRERRKRNEKYGNISTNNSFTLMQGKHILKSQESDFN